MCVKALQDQCVAKEEVVTRVRNHKEAVYTLNTELEATREKLEGASSQNKELKEELTTLRK